MTEVGLRKWRNKKDCDGPRAPERVCRKSGGLVLTVTEDIPDKILSLGGVGAMIALGGSGSKMEYAGESVPAA